MKIAIASGKGGTGKTMVAVSIAEILGPGTVLADLDVEEPNAGLYFGKVKSSNNKVHRMVPGVDYTRCNFCGICAEVCSFNAVAVLPGEILVFPELCHSCASCCHLCPRAAIYEMPYEIGIIEEDALFSGPGLVTGRLRIGEAQSPPLVKAAREEASRLGSGHVILDCPPGTGCSTLEAITGADYCLLVTEPTPFGSHDLHLALEAVELLGIRSGVIINRWRGSDANIDRLAARHEVPIHARIPFCSALAAAYAEGIHPLQAMPEMRAIIDTVLEELQVKNQ